MISPELTDILIIAYSEFADENVKTNIQHFLDSGNEIGLDYYLNNKLKYNVSWDALMPVIEKIESLPTDTENAFEFQFSITGDGIAITQFDDGSGIIANRVNEIGKSKLQSTFEVVVEFIKWYTTNKQS